MIGDACASDLGRDVEIGTMRRCSGVARVRSAMNGSASGIFRMRPLKIRTGTTVFCSRMSDKETIRSSWEKRE